MHRLATIKEIEDHLIMLGRGNHSDNMEVVRRFPRHYRLSLAEQEFMELVFLETSTLSKIVPLGFDRRLRAVALRASRLLPEDANLGSNWNIATMLARFRESDFRRPEFSLPELLLRDTESPSERRWSPDGWYLQDGSHRALAYCMMILAGEIQYSPQFVFCATSAFIN